MNKCPTASQVVCNYGVATPTIDSYQTSCGTEAGQLLNNVCNECWVSPLNTTVILYRCIWQTAAVSVTNTNCATPQGTTADSPNCVTTVTETTTTVLSPAQSNTVIDQFATVAGRLTTMMGDLYNGKVVIFIAGFVGAIVLGFVWLILVQWCAGVIVWVTMWGSVILCFAVTIFCFFQGGAFNVATITKGINTLQSKANTTYNFASSISHLNNSLNSFTSQLPQSLQNESAQTKLYWFYGGWVWLVISIILVTIVVALAEKVKV